MNLMKEHRIQNQHLSNFIDNLELKGENVNFSINLQFL